MQASNTVDEETTRYAQVLKIKQARLHELDKQAAAFGAIYTPPHIEMERVSLREELGMVETAIQSPARAEVTEELGPAGRFLVNYERGREIKQSIAAVLVKLETFVQSSEGWRALHRSFIIIIGIAVIVVALSVVVMATYLITRGGQ